MKNAHIIECRYLPATNFKSSRVKLTSLRSLDPQCPAEYRNDSIVESFGNYGQTYEQGEAMLTAMGYTILAQGEAANATIFAVKEFARLKVAHSAHKSLRMRKAWEAAKS